MVAWSLQKFYDKGKIMLKNILTCSTLLFFTACGGGGNSSNPSRDLNTSFQSKELYSFNLNFVDHRQRYDMKRIDAINSNITDEYFDFDSDVYEVDTVDKQLFVNGKRGALEKVTYALKSDGSIVASLENQEIFQLTLLEEKTVKKEELEEYGSKITIEGKVYITELKYLSNFHVVKDLISNDSFENLEAFVDAYKEKVFAGSILNGLSFGEDNTLTQHIENNTSNAGTYEIKTVDKKEVLFLYPSDTKRYEDNGCFILDFSRIWKAECRLKDSYVNVNFYDEAVYDAVLKYMQTAFVNVEISI